MKTYKIWLEIEEIDEEEDHFETVDRFELGEFATYAEAQQAAVHTDIPETLKDNLLPGPDDKEH